MSSSSPKRVLVTGGAGYVGSTVVQYFLRHGHHVTAVDRLIFGGEALLAFWYHPRFQFYALDLRDQAAVSRLLANEPFDAVIHLAAIVGDPACRQQPEMARETNLDSACHLVNESARTGVKRFVFASTCSNYGKMDESAGYVDEDSPLAPVSLYAELKVAFERYIIDTDFGRPDFVTTSLRFATVYGASPRMRFDLTVNDFVKDVVLGRKPNIYGDHCWRPYCHVRDFANAFETAIEADPKHVRGEIFNIGDTRENYTRGMIWDEIKKAIPEAQANFYPIEDDPRDYRVNFDKAHRVLGFQIEKTVPEGIREIRDIVSEGVIAEPDNPRHYNTPPPGNPTNGR